MNLPQGPGPARQAGRPVLFSRPSFTVCVTILLAWLGPLNPVVRPTPVSAQDTLEERLVSGDGWQTRALCSPGPVDVIILPHQGGALERWRPVLDGLSGRVGACVYARPDSGKRGWFELLVQLSSIHDRLQGTGTHRPPVLVGAGTGGLYARMLAQDRPAGVGGLVLVDPETEGWDTTLRRGMPPDAWEAEVDRLRAVNADGVSLRLLMARASEGSLPDIPVTVVTGRGEGSLPDGWTARWIQEALRRRHQGLVEGLALGRHRPLGSGSLGAPVSAPSALADEILRVVRLRERSGSYRGP